MSMIDCKWVDTEVMVYELDSNQDIERCNRWGRREGDPPFQETDADFARRMVESIAVAWWMRIDSER